jgi:hypothetical protein
LGGASPHGIVGTLSPTPLEQTSGPDWTLETLVPAPVHRPAEDLASLLAAILARPKPYASGPLAGAAAWVKSGRLKDGLLAFLLVPAAIAGSRVLAKWVELLVPPRKWRRPRKRGEWRQVSRLGDLRLHLERPAGLPASARCDLATGR